MITLQEYILEIVKYYDTNKYDLEQFDDCFNDLRNKWQEALHTYNEHCNIELNDDMRRKIEDKMQLVKDANQKLIKEVYRKNKS